jgi:hypothetical protein
VSPTKFCGEAAAPGARAALIGSRGRREAVEWLQSGQGDGEERGGGTATSTFFEGGSVAHGKKEEGRGGAVQRWRSTWRREKEGEQGGSMGLSE